MSYKENLAVFKQSKQIISQVNERTILAALQEHKKQNSDGEEVNIDLVFANPIPVTLTDDYVGIFRTDLCDTPALPITYQDSVNDFLSRTADVNRDMLTMLGGMILFQAECIKNDKVRICTQESIEYLDRDVKCALKLIEDRDKTSGNILNRFQDLIVEIFQLGLIYNSEWNPVKFPLDDFIRLTKIATASPVAEQNSEIEQFLQEIEDFYGNENDDMTLRESVDALYKVIRDLYALWEAHEAEPCTILDYWLLQFFIVFPDIFFYSLAGGDDNRADEICDLGYQLAYKLSFALEGDSLIFAGLLSNAAAGKPSEAQKQYARLLPYSTAYSAAVTALFIRKPLELADAFQAIISDSSLDLLDRTDRICSLMEKQYPYIHVPNPTAKQQEILNVYNNLREQICDLARKYPTASSALQLLEKDTVTSRKLFSSCAGIEFSFLLLFRGIEVLLRETLLIIRKINQAAGNTCKPTDSKYIKAFYDDNINVFMLGFASHFKDIYDAKEGSPHYPIREIIESVDGLDLMKSIQDSTEKEDILNSKIKDMRNAIVHCNTSDSDTDYTKLNEQILRKFLEWLRDVPSLISTLAELNEKLHHHLTLLSV